LRGAQTAHELLARAERMARFSSIEALRTDLDLLIGRRPPLVVLIERGPGQREERFMHLLSGAVQIAAVAMHQAPSGASALEERVSALEEEVAKLRALIEALTGGR
jgi:uncharacterized protein YceH (UPF0502 family)